ncbi:MAG: hypothetical protein KIT45_13075 [Fimbriimonadia bacterium]|nr:hypothetical protein [Fimbriimonadia bacterium]
MSKRVLLGCLTALSCAIGFTAYQVSVPDLESAQTSLFRGFDELERLGAYVVGEKGEKIGKIARAGVDALGNDYGAGNSYKIDGLFNSYSKYGSNYSSTSAFNKTATNPPKIVIEHGGDVYSIGLLTTNKFAQTRGQKINPHLLRAWIEAK